MISTSTVLICCLIGDDIEVGRLVIICATLPLSISFPVKSVSVCLTSASMPGDAMPEGGRIVIETHNLEIHEALPR